MMKKGYLIPIIGLFLIYFISLVYHNDTIGDITSPILTMLTFIPVFYGFYLKENNNILKISGLLYALSILSWFFFDFIWGVSTLVFHLNPESSLFITNGYSLTNLFLILSLLFSGYVQIKSLNKMQIFLDTMMVGICFAILIWLFIFDEDIERAKLLLKDWVTMVSLLTDIMIIAWTTILFFSIRNKENPSFVNFTAIGGVVYAITDITYYYIYFYQSYRPNTFLDGCYVIAFVFMGVAGWVKFKGLEIRKISFLIKSQIGMFKFKKELLFLLVPLIVFLFRGSQSQLLLLLITAIMFYFIFTNYTQKSIHREELLQKEKEYVLELEQRVEERTAEILKIMYTDVITGLKNRRYLEDYLGNLIGNINHNEKIYVLYIDINKYKSLKSVYGKYVAELTLKEIGKKIEKIMEEKNSIIASYAEDDFVVVYKALGNYNEIIPLTELIVKSCSDTYFIENNVFNITVNVGISCYPLDSKSLDDIIRNAYTAMIQARKEGYNVISKYDEQAGALLNKKDKIELKLKRVNYDEEFMLQYQPKVMCDDGSFIGVEALLRWITKNGEYIPPLDFIPITEENGMIIPLGYWIMEQAVKQLSKWRKDGNSMVGIAVNVSSKQLMHHNFAEKVQQILETYNVPSEFFEIEITESTQLESNTVIKENLHRLSDMGISIAIDDFGTGYSSLHYLKELPVNRIKIAKELIDHIENDIYSKSIVHMVISVAKVNNMKVIAEGVETKEQWDCLRDMDCDEIQGYLFSKPLNPLDVESDWFST